MRRGVTLIGIALLVAALAAATARAEGATTTGTTATTTTTGATTTTAGPTYEPLASSPLPPACVGAGIALISQPELGTAVLRSFVSSRGPSGYPAASPFLTFGSAHETGSTCRTAALTLSDVSLFGGAVTASSISAKHGKGTVSGLAVGGAPVAATTGEAVAIGSWGLLKLGGTSGRLSAPLVLHILKRHGPLMKGTTIFLGFSARPQPVAKTKAPATTATTHPSHSARHAARRHARHKKHVPQPLKWTPRLGQNAKHYVFPIDGGASYIDTYGANRNDIYDGWHHGDDLFAPLGTPVVAVAKGKLSLVGWNALGGWRIWLTDAKGNSFYYAHLSGYSRWILHHRNVKAGQVIGFLGRTGDAFTTTPHLHFEVHPHQLLKLGYDGAVDPTTYLKAWRVEKVPAAAIPTPARLRAPKGTPTQEAAVVWKELLGARHLMANGERVVAFAAGIRRPYPGRVDDGADSRRIAAVQTAATVAPSASAGAGPWPVAVLVLTLAVSGFGAFFSARRRRAAA